MELGKLEYLISVKTGNLDSELKKSETKVKDFGNKLSSWTVAKGQMIARVSEKMITATANAMKNTIKGAVSAFADYEQLVGGVDTLFKNSSKKVQDYASQAFRTVGISANEYMETVTSFSASLLQSLGNDTDKAADVADMAMTDMADNMNKMGSSMESIQNAYKGFAKQNYTMLDNLKLGYGGTKSEMQRLLKDAQKLTGQKYDIKNLKDVYEAIHAIQNEMGITGTTQKEAMSTVSGSMNAAKAAWKDVLTAIGRGKDVKKAVQNFGDTLKTALKNLRPVLFTSVKGIFQTVRELLPDIGSIVHDFVQDLKNSDSPVLRKVGEALEKIEDAFKGVTALITDFPTTIKNMKASDSPGLKFLARVLEDIQTLVRFVQDAFEHGLKKAIENLTLSEDPFAQFVGGGLHALYDFLTFVSGKEGLAGVIEGIAKAFLMFKGVTIASSFLSFLTKLKGFGNGANLKKILEALNGAGYNGGSPTTSPTTDVADTVTKTNLWTKLKDGAKTTGTAVLGFAKKILTSTAFTTMLPALLVGGTVGIAEYFNQQNRAQWKADEERRLSSSYGNDEEDFIRKAAIALTPSAEHGGMQDFDMVESLLKGLQSRQNEQKAKLATTLGKDLWLQLNSYWNNPENFDMSMVDELLQNITDKFAESSKKVDVPMEPDTSEIDKRMALGWDSNVRLYPIQKGLGQAKGNWYVPYDNYPSLLHRGEMVLSKSQARQLRDGQGESGVDITRAINEAFSKVYVMMSGEKVGDLTTKRVKNNINANSYSRIRAYGG